MSPERLEYIRSSLERPQCWALPMGDFVNATEELVEEVDRLRAALREAEGRRDDLLADAARLAQFIREGETTTLDPERVAVSLHRIQSAVEELEAWGIRCGRGSYARP